VLANGLLILVAAHVAAALWHHFIRRDGTLRRIIPGRG
jgi:cytochrome b561